MSQNIKYRFARQAMLLLFDPVRMRLGEVVEDEVPMRRGKLVI